MCCVFASESSIHFHVFNFFQFICGDSVAFVTITAVLGGNIVQNSEVLPALT